MENDKKYLFICSTNDWKIVKCEIASETRYTWKTIYGFSYSKNCYNDWNPKYDNYQFWNPDLEELKRTKKENIEFKIKILKRDIERLESALLND